MRAHLSSGRRYPPYGREFALARRLRQYVNPWLFGGPHAWELASHKGPGRLVLPEGADPESFYWGMVEELPVVLRWPEATPHQIDALSVALLRDRARSVIDLGSRTREAERLTRISS